MKLGIFTVLFSQMPFEEMLDHVAAAGVDAVEIGTGGYPGNAHCDREALLASPEKRSAFLNAITSRGLEISALSCHNNPLHPNAEVRQKADQELRETIRLAAELGVKTVVTFSGCPGESERSENPVWVTCPWPEEYSRVLEWQWKEKVIPYWTEMNRFAADHGVRIAIEAHPGFVVYNGETLLRLREACGEQIGINFDPSHMFWQGIDPVEAVHALAPHRCIFHVHAKDTGFNKHNVARDGVLDTKPYREELKRAWIFRTVGYGHDQQTWADLLSALQMNGYDGVISIEHEDSLMSIEEGFQKAVAFLRPLVIREKLQQMWWA
ncbi:sugar phosphate isomerase/epimerase family protein [Alicyclobacillus acidocaldarius]|uniref:Xylose isomerase domain protein TIM barrel n=1 Tax=Alicyclobacillus acidocaldarius (strain Tc-4-1) TaxID=1048834 RepID=F8IG27_ALIAT|nr:sugar phosphate isomerase/epimerase [Alicyclobacillus acidocaldarius]AEJ44180.1 Xylose isomerase domain protein TIM barrel [Alicyclobacillus acidocaldarius subsp. acidocaldarius Tc-4-1]